MPEVIYVGETIRLEITVADKDGVVFDPDILIISTVAPNGTITSHSTDDVDPTIFNTDVGIYWTYFLADAVGAWTVRVELHYTENGEDVIERKTERRAVYAWAT